MTPEESTALATWFTVAVAGAFGLTGFIVGLVGLHHSRQAKDAAAGANLVAKDANSLATKANTISEEANGIAREANEIARATSKRADEQHDVDWEWEFMSSPHESMIEVQNIGKNTAFDVTIQFMFEDVTEANNQPMEIAGREKVKFEIPGLREAIEAERAEVARVEALQGPQRIVAITVPRHPEQVRTRLRVKWRSESGAPHRYDSRWQVVLLPE